MIENIGKFHLCHGIGKQYIEIKWHERKKHPQSDTFLTANIGQELAKKSSGHGWLLFTFNIGKKTFLIIILHIHWSMPI